jgi:hypothetical protein
VCDRRRGGGWEKGHEKKPKSGEYHATNFGKFIAAVVWIVVVAPDGTRCLEKG